MCSKIKLLLNRFNKSALPVIILRIEAIPFHQYSDVKITIHEL